MDACPTPAAAVRPHAMRLPFQATAAYVRRVLSSPLPPKPQPLPFGEALYHFTMRPAVPVCFALAYIATMVFFNARRPNGRDRLRGPVAKAAVFAHNLLLAVYSAWTFVAIAPAMAAALTEPLRRGESFRHGFCGSDGELFVHTISPVAYVFYLSKAYEVVDSFILLAKGKKVGTLQLFHHSGALLSMYAGVRFEGVAIWIFACFNSFIHAIMYSYYAASTVHIRVPSIVKRSLTTLQISQFLVGGSIAASYLFIRLPPKPSIAHAGGQCTPTEAARFAVFVNICYLAPLTWLFVQFFRDTYKRNQRDMAKKHDKAL